MPCELPFLIWWTSYSGHRRHRDSSVPQPIRLPDLGKHPQSYGFPPNHPPMKSFLGAPIVGRKGPMGNLYLTEKQGADTFTDEDEAIAVMRAGQAAVAVENVRLQEESAR